MHVMDAKRYHCESPNASFCIHSPGSCQKRHNEPVVTRITFWWDRLSRNWIVQALDSEGNQIGDAIYAANRRTLPGALASMTDLYPNIKPERL